MSNVITLKKIVAISSQDDAASLFLEREKHNIGGVIFTPKMAFPKWLKKEQSLLESFSYHGDPRSGNNVGGVIPPYGWEEASRNKHLELISLSREFNRSEKFRTVMFAVDDNLIVKPHRDIAASNGWIHIHLEGSGLLCASAKGDNPVDVRAEDFSNEKVDQEDFNDAIHGRNEIETIALQAGQAIAFDDSIVHYSSIGPRFRIITLG